MRQSRGSVQRHLENVEKRRRTRSSSVGEDSSIFNVCGRAGALETERERDRDRDREKTTRSKNEKLLLMISLHLRRRQLELMVFFYLGVFPFNAPSISPLSFFIHSASIGLFFLAFSICSLPARPRPFFRVLRCVLASL